MPLPEALHVRLLCIDDIWFIFRISGEKKDVMCGQIHTTSGTDLDVKGVDAQLLASRSDVLSSQHGSVGGGLVTVGLDLHTTSHTGDGLATTIEDVRMPTFVYRRLKKKRPPESS